MEALVASAVGIMTAAGIFLILRRRTFPVILGLSLITYAVNVFLFATGRLALNAPAVLNKYKDVPYTDPLPQALVLTAIVISFGMDRRDRDDLTQRIPVRQRRPYRHDRPGQC